MQTKLYPLFCLLGLLLAACQNGNPGDATAATDTTHMQDMAGLADDPAFVAAHPNPDSLSFSARGEMMTFPTPGGGQPGSAYVVRTDGNPDDQYLFVIHEWWGLNDYIKREAERLAASLPNTTVMALDLYDGKVATRQEEAQQFMQAVSEDRGQAIINGALDYVGPDASIGTIGWCFGGGWSLRTAIQAGERAEACVMYYGMPVDDAAALAPLQAPVLGIFASQDGWINTEVVQKFKNLAQATGKDVTVRTFNAAHAFANPSNPDYNGEAAREANALALDFLKEKM